MTVSNLDLVIRIATLLISAGIFTALVRLVVWAINLEPRIQSIEKETMAHGTMIQQFTSSVARIEGRLEDGWKERQQ